MNIIKPILSLTCALVVSGGLMAQDMTITNVNIVDVTNGVILNNKKVIVEDGIIKKITKATKAKGDMIDGEGKYLSPGLIDSHMHFANFTGTKERMQNFSSSLLRCGITTLRDVGGSGDIIKEHNNYVANGEYFGPYIYFSTFWAGTKYFGMSRNERTDVYWNQDIDKHTDYAAMIDLALSEGCTGIKLYHSIKPDTYRSIVALCKEKGLKVWSHFSVNPTNSIDVIKAGAEVVSHSYLMENERGFTDRDYENIRFSDTEKAKRKEVFTEMIKRGTILDPTVYLCSTNSISYNTEYTKEALACGVKIVAGTDFATFEEDGSINPIFFNELDCYRDLLKMSNADILRSATVNGAYILGMKDKLGVIKEGAEADLIVLSSNPLENIDAYKNNIENVYTNGVQVK